jgi:hypothetical protein
MDELSLFSAKSRVYWECPLGPAARVGFNVPSVQRAFGITQAICGFLTTANARPSR